eukprot:COSAG05_NODE_202_length_14312_cov_7.897629_7_plen_402_part_00
MPPPALALLLGALLAAAPHQPQNRPQTQPFTGGLGGYPEFRIPSLLHLTNGDLLLFVEARGKHLALLPMASTTDGGATDVVTRRSTDLGQTWGALSVVHTETTPSHVVTIGNPSPVELSASHPGTIVLSFCRNNEKVGVMTSTDNGATWGAPTYVIDHESVAFRKQLGVPAAKTISHIATGPPTSIQLPSGRIIVPTAFCYDGGAGRCRSQKPGDWFAAVLYSDDFGRSFAVSNKEDGGNECQAAQLANGSLILNQRTRGPRRQLSYSHDAGQTWTKPRPVALAGTGAATCCGSTVFVKSDGGDAAAAKPAAKVSAGDGMLVFSGPDSSSRKNMSIYTSVDSGSSWQWLYQLGDPSLAGAYSSLAVINVSTCACPMPPPAAAQFQFVSVVCIRCVCVTPSS